MTTKTTTAAGGEKIASTLAHLTRALKTPTIARTWQDLAAMARD